MGTRLMIIDRQIKNSSFRLAIPIKALIFAPRCPGGGIGRRVGLKHQCRKTCRFEPDPGY